MSHDDRLVWIAMLSPRSGRVGNVSCADYLGYRDRSTTLSAVLASGGSALSVGSGRPQRVLGGLVSVTTSTSSEFVPHSDARSLPTRTPRQAHIRSRCSGWMQDDEVCVLDGPHLLS
jgi:hypothetical protein